jgi:hypothetical protein
MKGICDAPLDMARIIREGQYQGIYTYLIFLGDDTDEAAALLKIFALYPESAFIVFSDFNAVSDFLSHDAFDLKNIVISIGLNQPSYLDYAGCLTVKKRFFGVHAYYDDADIPAILSGGYMERMTETGAALANFIAKKSCSPYADSRIAGYIANMRADKAIPFFPSPFFRISLMSAVSSCRSFRIWYIFQKTARQMPAMKRLISMRAAFHCSGF